ncbi:hypothetical protein M569_07166 [Genlisea aurea]|uniref:Uncharacterized protein n=1 Tax=Genlisea aurea TaxID=192259 RepID=S8DWN4_9LAMI|nr:hypothetical protein M569_07166 [Genlisea aurea]
MVDWPPASRANDEWVPRTVAANSDGVRFSEVLTVAADPAADVADIHGAAKFRRNVNR